MAERVKVNALKAFAYEGKFLSKGAVEVSASDVDRLVSLKLIDPPKGKKSAEK